MKLLILTIIMLGYVFELLVDWLNVRNASPEVPQEFAEIYDAKRYKDSQNYLQTNTRFGFISDSLSTVLLLLFIASGAILWLDKQVARLEYSAVVSGLLYFGVLMVVSQIINLPFSWYHTFNIEEKFGFNRTTPKTFVTDRIKGWVLTLLIGAPIGALVLWFFIRFPQHGWWYCWAALFVIQFVLMAIAPTLLMPLFNKFEPLEDGELKSAIQGFTDQLGFQVAGIYTMDGSKRSAKANAFFTGFGPWRRIVLFDTLIEKHSVNELVAVLAHEIGHNRLHHIPKTMLLGTIAMGAQFYLLGLLLRWQPLYLDFGFEGMPVHIGLILFSFLFGPVNLLLSLGTNALSRKHEFEADAFAAQTTGQPEDLITGLKQLSSDTLSNLTPHPLKVKLAYSHPPVLERIAALRRQSHSQ